MKTDPVLVVMMTAMIIALYFTPWLVALWRKHEREKSVFYINFFFGWTLLGWVIALVLAIAGRTRPPKLRHDVEPARRAVSGGWVPQETDREPGPPPTGGSGVSHPREFTAKHGPRPRYGRTQRPPKARRV